MAEKVISLDRIRTDLNTQSRVEINEDIVNEYAEAMDRQETFPPMLVYYDMERKEYVLADGFHRYHALCKLRPGTDVTVDRRYGTAEDAQWVSIASNVKHGLRRTSADKRKAIRLALLHSKGAGFTDRKIGRHVGVDHKTVAPIRAELVSGGEIPQVARRQGLDGKFYPVRSGTCNESVGACGTCDAYNGRVCTFDEKVYEPWAQGCEDYAEKLEDVPPMPPPPPADQENITIIDTPDKNPKRTINQHAYQKRKGRISVRLPPDDVKMFAVELRHHFDNAYLAECIQVLSLLLADTEITEAENP